MKFVSVTSRTYVRTYWPSTPKVFAVVSRRRPRITREPPKMHAQAVQFLSFLWLAWPLASGALEESRLEVVDIQPCFVSRKVVSRSNSITYSLKANFSLCENFSDSSYVSIAQLHVGLYSSRRFRPLVGTCAMHVQ